MRRAMALLLCRILGHDEFTGFSFERMDVGYRCARCGATRYVEDAQPPAPEGEEGGE